MDNIFWISLFSLLTGAMIGLAVGFCLGIAHGRTGYEEAEPMDELEQAQMRGW